MISKAKLPSSSSIVSTVDLLSEAIILLIKSYFQTSTFSTPKN